MRLWIVAVAAIAACSFAGRAIAAPQTPTVIATPWSKFCLTSTEPSHQICFTGQSSPAGCEGPVASAGVSESSGNGIKRLQITLRTKVNMQRGARIVIDEGPPIFTASSIHCFSDSCLANYDGGPELISQLKSGRTLAVEAIDSTNQPFRIAISLAGFAEAYDQPPSSLDHGRREAQLQAQWSVLMLKLEQHLMNPNRQRAEAAISKPSCDSPQ